MKTIITTSTFYKSVDEVRCQLAIRFLKAAVEAGYITVMVDGSGPEVHEALKTTGARVFPELHRGMGLARRQSVFHASQIMRFEEMQEDGIIFWIEPEKIDMVRHIPAVIVPIEADDADIVIVRRNMEIMRKTYPPYQFESEWKANEIYWQATKRDGFDPFSGLVAYRLNWAEKLLTFQPHLFDLIDDYIHHYVPIMCPNHRVASVEVDFYYPPEQLAAEIGDTSGEPTEAMKKRRDYQLKTIAESAYVKLGAHFKPWLF